MGSLSRNGTIICGGILAARRFWSLASEYVHVPTKLVRGFQFTQRSDQRNSRGTPHPSEVGLSRSHRHQHGCLPHWSVAVVVGDRQQVLDGLPNVLVLHRTASLQVTTVFRGHCHCRVCPETIGRSTSSHCQMQVMWLTGRPRFRGFFQSLLIFHPTPLLLFAHNHAGFFMSSGSGSQLVGSGAYHRSSLHRSSLHRRNFIEDMQQAVPLQLDPLDVRFTHDEISAHFRDGSWVDQTFQDVVGSKLDPSEIPACDLVHSSDGLIWSLSNRRFNVFHVLRVMGHFDVLKGVLFDFDSVRAQRKKANPRNCWK